MGFFLKKTTFMQLAMQIMFIAMYQCMRTRKKKKKRKEDISSWGFCCCFLGWGVVVGGHRGERELLGF